MTPLRPALLLAAAALACASGPRPLVLAAANGAPCRAIGQVEATAPAESRVDRNTLVYWAERDALTKAAAQGATHVLLTGQDARLNEGRTTAFMYQCP
jgi:hypothetical protein